MHKNSNLLVLLCLLFVFPYQILCDSNPPKFDYSRYLRAKELNEENTLEVDPNTDMMSVLYPLFKDNESNVRAMMYLVSMQNHAIRSVGETPARVDEMLEENFKNMIRRENAEFMNLKETNLQGFWEAEAKFCDAYQDSTSLASGNFIYHPDCWSRMFLSILPCLKTKSCTLDEVKRIDLVKDGSLGFFDCLESLKTYRPQPNFIKCGYKKTWVSDDTLQN
jgi:hypothetical protein